MTTLLQPLPFYLTNDDLYHKRINCKNECFFELHSPSESLLPFIIKRPTSPNPVSLFTVRCQDGSSTVVLDPLLIKIPCTIIEDGIKYDLLVYDGADIGETIDCGFKQIQVGDGVTIWSSELFLVGDFQKDTAPFYKYAYSHSCDLKDVPYSDDDIAGFEFYFFMPEDVQWGVPQVSHEITDQSDGLGRSLIESQRIEKIFTLETGFIPEYLLDAISFSMLHDSRELQEKMSTVRSKLLQLELSHEPDSNGCFHETILNFKIEQDVVSGSCCDVLEKPECISQANVQNVVSTAVYFFQNQIEQLPPNDGDCYWIATFSLGCPANEWCDHLGEVACWDASTSSWIYNTLEDFDVIYNVALDVFFMWVSGGLVEIPLITLASPIGMPLASIDIEADIHPCYFGRLEWSYDGGGTWTEVAGLFTYQELQDGVNVGPKGLNPTQIRIVMYNFTCPEIIGNEINV